MLNGIKLIGISGHAGSGKDSIAKYIHTFYQDVWVEHFADPLKDCASAAFGVARDLFDDPELKNVSIPYWNFSPRKMAQFVGTELFRDATIDIVSDPSIDHSFWVHRLQGKLLGELILDGEGEYSEGDTVLIPDVRFQDEVDWICANGGFIINVRRPGYEGAVGIPNHASEQLSSLNIPIGASYGVNNSTTLPQLFQAVESILENNPFFSLTRK